MEAFSLIFIGYKKHFQENFPVCALCDTSAIYDTIQYGMIQSDYKADSPYDWDQWLDPAEFAYITSKQNPQGFHLLS